MNYTLNYLTQIAHGIAQQFGQNCEIVIHDLASIDLENTVVYIENGHVTKRNIGDGPSHVVLEASRKDQSQLKDRYGYLTRTQDGRILKSSTIYIRGDDNKIRYIFSINFDITAFSTIDGVVKSLISTEPETKAPERITQNVNDLLDDLIEESVSLIGKPVALMTKEEKVTAIQFLNDAGAFLITRSGDKVSKYFGISKYTLYSYIDVNKTTK
ncbi:helix-turn-helix transcriptional regulator [Anaerocolumna sp.]|uniref:helix-turn-helix transcriptional regulator n=1 Tax=Anaerocolumna sp. TaxID=2041569 RepID=UPI0028AB1DF4|nr:helix-turn-helix transcriptional regulator [Anaerocolumna sp.]